MQIYLKVKIKTLTAEAQIIRKEERKAKTSRAYRRDAKHRIRNGIAVETAEGKGFRGLTNAERDLAVKKSQPPTTEQLDLFWGLQSHRKGVVREEARATHIAYGYLRGKQYHQLETAPNLHSSKKWFEPNWDKVEAMVKKYGTKEQIEGFASWKKSAK